ncbi:MAG: hypothetical protein RLZZ196_191 [Bacteroidota bacterium]|jgi:flagellar biosynthesis/type III secretory pathway protein FliH
MNKFSLLTRLNHSKYEDGHSAGWQEGFEIGSVGGVKEAKKVFIKLLQKQLKSASIEDMPGLVKSIQIIKEHK